VRVICIKPTLVYSIEIEAEAVLPSGHAIEYGLILIELFENFSFRKPNCVLAKFRLKPVKYAAFCETWETTQPGCRTSRIIFTMVIFTMISLFLSIPILYVKPEFAMDK
jgi:hypothetical protein